MDPLSVTGTVVGIISLGLQVTQGLIQYYNLWRDFSDDVKSTYDSIHQLNATFNVLHGILENHVVASRPATSVIENGITACRGAISTLQKKLDKIEIAQPSHEFVSSRSRIIQGIRAQGKHVLYPFRQGTLGKLRDTVASLRDDLSPAVQALGLDLSSSTLAELKALHSEQLQWRTEDENRKILSWLSPLDFQEQLQDRLITRYQGTGTWLILESRFQHWLKDSVVSQRGLWCHGKMGCGKSILMASAIEHLQNLYFGQDVRIAYLFCDWQDVDAQNSENLIGALLKQVVQSQSSMPASISSSYHRHRNGNLRLPLTECISLLKELTRTSEGVIFILDGLDESAYQSRGQSNPLGPFALEAILCAMLRDSEDEFGHLRLLVSSRFLPTDHNQSLFDCVEIKPSKQDLAAYINGSLTALPFESSWTNPDLVRQLRRNTSLCENIVEECLARSNDSFLLSRMHLSLLKDKLTLRDLTYAVNNLPLEFDVNVQVALLRVKKQTSQLQKLGVLVLLWLSQARRPLRIKELQHAVAVNDGDDHFDETGILPVPLIIQSCAGLVILEHTSQIVRLISLSVGDYLSKSESNWVVISNAVVTRTCITYLEFKTFTSQRDSKESLQEATTKLLQESQLLDYSINFWPEHYERADTQELTNRVIRLLSDNRRTQFMLYMLYQVLFGDIKACPQDISGLHLAALFGLTEVSKGLLEGGISANIANSDDRTPLFLAAAKGHLDCMNLLLFHRANASGRSETMRHYGKSLEDTQWWLPAWARDNCYDSALQAAAEGGFVSVAESLIKHGAPIDYGPYIFPTALEAAAFRGHANVVKLLLTKGAKITQDSLQAAIWGSNVEVLRLLVEGVKLTTSSQGHLHKFLTHFTGPSEEVLWLLENTLYAAALLNQIPCAELLLSEGIDPNALSQGHYGYPLQAAAALCHVEMVKLLLNRKASCQGTGQGHHGSPLIAAASHGSIAIVEELISRGANVDGHFSPYGTALQNASQEGHIDIVKLLLSEGANKNIIGGRFGTAIQAAAASGHSDIASLLLQKGADLNAVYGECGTALAAAACSNDVELVRLFLASGAKTRYSIYQTGYNSYLGSQRLFVGNVIQAAIIGIPDRVRRDITEVVRNSWTEQLQDYERRRRKNMNRIFEAGDGLERYLEVIEERTVAENIIRGQIFGHHPYWDAGSQFLAQRKAQEKMKRFLDDAAGRTAFYKYIRSRHTSTLEILKELIKNGAEVDSLDEVETFHWGHGSTIVGSIEAAAVIGDVDVFHELLNAGASLEQEVTPVRERNSDPSEDEPEPPLNTKYTTGEVALEISILCGNVDIAEELLKRGIRLRCMISDDQSPLVCFQKQCEKPHREDWREAEMVELISRYLEFQGF